jgi:hypothetical protein
MRSTGADLGRPLATDEPEPVLHGVRPLGERLLEVALDAVLLEPGVLAELVLELREHLGDADLETVFAPARPLSNDDRAVTVLDHRGRRHPVEGLVASRVGMDEDRAVRLEDEEPDRLRQVRGEAAGVGDLAAGDDETHGAGTVPPRTDVSLAQRSLLWR